MKRFVLIVGVLAIFAAVAWSYITEIGPDWLLHDSDVHTIRFFGDNSVESGASLDIESGATFEIAGVAVTSSAAELNVLDGIAATLTAAELSLLDGITSANIANWNSAYGWGSHAVQNYFDIDANDLDDIPEGVTYGKATLTQISNWDIAYGWDDHSIQNYFDIDANDLDDVPDGITYGKATLTQISNWDIAYGWDDHSIQNYFDIDANDLDDIPDGTTYGKATLVQISNWDVAYGWDDHSTQNYFDIDVNDLDDVPDGTTYGKATLIQISNWDAAYGSDPSADGIHAHRVARATYDVSGGDPCAVGAHELGVALPDNAVIVRASLEVLIAFDSAEHDETVSFGIATDDTVGILALTDLGTTGFKATIQDDGLAVSYSEKTTAERQLIATVAVHDATAGKAILWVEYIVSD